MDPRRETALLHDTLLPLFRESMSKTRLAGAFGGSRRTADSYLARAVASGLVQVLPTMKQARPGPAPDALYKISDKGLDVLRGVCPLIQCDACPFRPGRAAA